MLLPFLQLIRKYNMNIRGVIHGGAHHLEEYELYKQAGIKNIIAIEPCDAAFSVLKRLFGQNPDVILFNHALGNAFGKATMHTEITNGGQSNSLLVPDKHLEQYPSIVFAGEEEVDVELLDNLPFDRALYNMMNFDLQGYEGYALQGATKTLKHIDYIITEVNRDSVYKMNTLVDELDIILSDFQRMETDWTGGSWGDALYIRKSLL